MFKKVRDWLGIEGVKVELTVIESFYRNRDKISGTVLLSSKTDQFIESLNFRLVEKYSRGRSKSKLIDEYQIGDHHIQLNRGIKADSTIEIPFSISYAFVSAPIDDFGNKNFFFKGISKVAKLAKNAKSEFRLICEAKVKGNALKPYHNLTLDMA